MKFFLIDDDELSLFLTETVLLLVDDTFEVEAFQSASDALQVLITSGVFPDFILLDLNMPSMDGWEFLDSLGKLEKSIEGKCFIYVLTSSVNVSECERIKGYTYVQGLFRKPIQSEAISDMVARKNLF